MNQDKKLAVIGSRNFNDYNLLMTRLNLHKPSMIISGGANGADSLANQYAKANGLPILIFYPNWNGLGKSAGLIRNTQIIDAADEVAAFWNQTSKGTLDSIEKARRSGKTVYVYTFEDYSDYV